MRRFAEPSIRTALLGAILVFAACERTRDVYVSPKNVALEVDKGAIAIGTFGSMTGRYGFASVQAHLGLVLAVEECNARGGIRDRQLALEVFDDQGRVDGSTRAGEHLALVDRSVVVFGGSDDEHTVAAAKVSKDVSIVCASCGDEAQVRRGVHALGLSSEQRAHALADIATRALAAKSVGVVVRAGRVEDEALARDFEREFKALGGAVASVVVAAPAQLDEALAAWKSVAPEVVVLACSGRDVASIAQALRTRGILAKLVLADAPAPGSLNVDELAAIDAAHAVSAVAPEFAHGDEGDFAVKFRARFVGRAADESAWLGYAAGVFAFDALAHTKTYGNADVGVALDAAHEPERHAVHVELESGLWRSVDAREGRP